MNLKKLALVAAALVAVFSFVGCGSSAGDAKYKQISPSEAPTAMAADSNYLIVDVRTAEEFAEGHILGAINIPNESIGTEEIAALPDKEQHIYVYCRSGNRSKQAAEKLADLGYTNIIEFGGIQSWPGEVVTDIT